MKTVEDGWYIVINAYQLTVFDILRDFFVLPYIACPRYPYIRVYRLYDIDISQYGQSQYNINTSYYSIDISKYCDISQYIDSF